MSCPIAIDINKSKYSNTVRRIGGKSTIAISESKFNLENFTQTFVTPSRVSQAQSKANKLPEFDRSASIFFSGIPNTGGNKTNTDISKLDKKTQSMLTASGLTGEYIGDVLAATNKMFKSDKKIVSTTPNHSMTFIVATDGDIDDSKRDFFRLTDAKIAKLKKDVRASLDVEVEGKEMDDLLTQAVEFAVISALYRGYSIAVSPTADNKPIESAIKKFSKHLNPGSEVFFGSSEITSPSVFKFNDVNEFITDTSTESTLPAAEVSGSNSTLLTAFLSPAERRTFNKRQKASKTSKLFVLQRVASVFKNMMPGLSVETLSNHEIISIYGDAFKGAKGFTIEGKIVINTDAFDSSTIFHEFGHFYMSWLKAEHPDIHRAILDNTKAQFGGMLKMYQAAYDRSGTQMTEGAILEEIFADQLGLKAAGATFRGEVYVDGDLAYNEFGERTVEEFTNEFLKVLTSNKTLDLAGKKFNLDSTIASMFEVATMFGGNSSPLISNLDSKGLSALKNFFIEKVSPTDVYNGLAGTGHIVRVSPTHIALYDNSGNRMDKNGKPTNKPLIYPMELANKASTHLRKVRNKNKNIQTIEGYLNKMKNVASAQFSKTVEPLSVYSKIVENSENSYGDQFSTEKKGITKTIQDEFSKEFETEKFMRQMVANKFKQKYKDSHAATENPLEDEKAAIEATLAYVEEEGADFLKEMADVKTIFEFKTTEGTYLHNIAELFTRAINYSQKIDYGEHVKNRSHTYFMKHILDAILGITADGKTSDNPKDAFVAYFEKFFFNHLTDDGSLEYAEFKASFDWAVDQMGFSTKDTAAKTRLLTNLDKVLKDEIFDELPGPITLMPEVKLGSSTLGVRGIIDLLVIDGKGVAHIFDYKSKEVNKEGQWDYVGKPDRVKLKGAMDSYDDNAMMKASIQTSVYRLMLAELGIQTGPSHVLYVESDILVDEDITENKDKLRYNVKRIIKKPLIDVSVEMLAHFESKGIDSELIQKSKHKNEIPEFIRFVSGNYDIDNKGDLDEYAISIYEKALADYTRAKDKPAYDDEGEKINSKAGILGITFGGSVSAKFRIYLPGGASEIIPSDITGEDERIAYIKDILVRKGHIKGLDNDLERMFLGLDRSKRGRINFSGSNDKIMALGGLLYDADSSTHELTKMASNIDYGIDFTGISMLKNKATGETRLIVINHDREENLAFGVDQSRRNIFGNFASTREVKVKVPTVEWSNTTHNMRKIKAGLLMITQRHLDPSFRVSNVLSNSSFQDRVKPDSEDVATILMMTKQMIDFAMRSDPSKVPDSIKEMLKDPKLFEAKSYVKNPINSLSTYLGLLSSSGNNFKDLFKTGERTGKEHAANLKKIVDTFNPNTDTDALLASLHSFRLSLERTMPDVDDRLKSDIWTLTDNVIMSLMGFNYTINPGDASFAQKFLTTSSKSANVYQSTFNRKIQEGANNVRQDFTEYKNEFKGLLKDLADHKGINLNLPTLAGRNKVMFDNLYVSEDLNATRKTAFILKSPDAAGLHSSERAILRFFKKTSQAMADLSTHRDVTIPDGWMPLIPKSAQGKSADTNVFESAKKRFKETKESDYSKQRKDTRDSAFRVENIFDSQFPTGNGDADNNFSSGRRMILGVDYVGNDTSNPGDLNLLEDNVENVLDTLVLASLEAAHLKDVTSFGRAMLYNVHRYENLTGVPLNGVVEVLTLIQKRIINHEESAGNSGKFMKGVNKFTTHAAIAGTVNQALLEAFTNPMVTTANYIGDKLYGTMFAGTREFSLASYNKAIAYVWANYGPKKDLINAIDRNYGITTADTRALKKTLNEIEKSSIFESDHLMFVNKLMLENWQKITMTAFMIEQGSFEAHSLDEFGNLQYDEDKDKRFEGRAHDPHKQKIYETVKTQMAKQRNGLTGSKSTKFEERQLKKAWTTYDSNYVKEMIVEIYSSMDETSKSLATYYTELGFISKMRTWIFAKVPRYFQKPMTAEENASASQLQKVEDPDAPNGYRMEYKGSDTEGIIFTVGSIMRQISIHKTQVIKNGELTEAQKKNVTKLAADVIVFGTLMAAASGLFKYALDDDDRKDPAVQLVYQRFTMAASDVFMLKSLMDMTTGQGSMFIALSVMHRLTTSLFQAGLISSQAIIDPDTTYADALSAWNNVARNSSGFYRTLQAGADAAFLEEDA